MIVFDVLYQEFKFVEIFDDLKFRRTCAVPKSLLGYALFICEDNIFTGGILSGSSCGCCCPFSSHDRSG